MKLKLITSLLCLTLTHFAYAYDEDSTNGRDDQEEVKDVEMQDFRDDEEIDYSLLESGKADIAVGSKKGVSNSFFIGMSPSFAQTPIQTQRSLISDLTKETYDGIRYYKLEDGKLVRIDTDKD